MGKKTVDIEEFAKQIVVFGKTDAEAYRIAADYVPEGDKDNSRILAYKLKQKDSVQKALRKFQSDQFRNIGQVSLKRLEELLTDKFDTLDPKTQVKLVIDTCKLTGNEAAKMSHTVHTVENRITNVDDLVTELLKQPTIAGRIAPVIEAEIVGEPGGSEGADAAPEPEEHE